jgi:hypothetical protein
MSTSIITSDRITGFVRVDVALGLKHCGERSLIPYDVTRTGNFIEVECPGCGVVVFAVEIEEPNSK